MNLVNPTIALDLEERKIIIPPNSYSELLACRDFLSELCDQFTENTYSSLIEDRRRSKCSTSSPRSDRPKGKENHWGFVYLMKNGGGYTKIGFSTNPKFREKTLQAQEPDVEIFFLVKANMKHEDSVQEKFSPKRVRGEWFDLTDDEVMECQAFLSEITANSI